MKALNKREWTGIFWVIALLMFFVLQLFFK